MPWIHLRDEIPILDVIHVRAERYVFDQAIEGLASSFQGYHFLGLVHDFLREGVFNGVSRDHDPVLGLGAPAVEQLPANPILQHPGGGKHHTRPAIIESLQIDASEISNVPEFERIPDIHLGANPHVHHVGVGLVHPQSPRGEFGRVPNGDLLEMGVLRPVFIENQEELLRPTEGKHGYEAFATTGDNLIDRFGESTFPFLTRLVDLHPVRGFHNQHIRPQRLTPYTAPRNSLGNLVGNLGLHQMPIVLHAIIPRVQHGPSPDLNHEHGRSQHVTRVQRPEFQSSS
mmetsp:Transcript_45903/g.55237  ORF Transcript_45903/g.55237 Transcript_45903/m.55237 type:complete len:286 (-) Transcript_45903:280-1137(-)